MITYKRPTTIGQKLTNYKDVSLNETRKQTKGGSRPCEHYAVCGCYGKNNKSMVPNVSQLLTKTKTFKLNQSLACADFGIYVATCVICHEQYVGQTNIDCIINMIEFVHFKESQYSLLHVITTKGK